MTNQNSFIVACGHCGAKNRVPADRMREKPVCGKCKTPLNPANRFPDHAVDVRDGVFPDEVLRFPGTVAVFFWAPWCVYCRTLLPVFERLSREYAGKMKFVKVNMDQEPGISSRYDVMSAPTTLVMRKGHEVDRLVGSVPALEFERRLRQFM